MSKPERVAKPTTLKHHAALVRAYTKARKDLEREKDRTQVMKDILVAGVLSVEVLPFILPEPPTAGNRLPQSAILDLSDWHIGERVTTEDVYGRKPYDLQTTKLRSAQLGSSVLEITSAARANVRLDDLLIILGGDLFTGEAIFPGQAHELEINVLEQFLEGTQLLTQLINTLSESFATIRVEAVPGNHGRLGKPGDYHHRSNLETILLTTVQTAFAGHPRVTFNVSNSDVAYVEYAGHKLAIGHGSFLAKGKSVTRDTIIQRAAAAWPSLLQRSVDMVFVHHWHSTSLQDVGGTKVFINGSLVGGNYFSSTVLRTYNPPEQWYVRVNERRITGFNLITFID